ncbi:MAG TPA: hypothetical protein VMV37_08975 [Gammaproteobacteria bacterium]|nr:hypothetical protein [Gammaproteobacteria bacterium]
MNKLTGFSALGALLLATGAFADGPRTDQVVDRDVNQQERVEQGLQQGQLNTREAGQIEREESRIDRTEARDLKDGKLSPAEQAHINEMQNKTSRDIYRDRHNAAGGNPDSKSSERLQADVQRNVNQQQRIEQGGDNGTLTNREVGSLEAGQARTDRKEGVAAGDGHVGAGEQARIQRSDNHQSRRIHRKKANS